MKLLILISVVILFGCNRKDHWQTATVYSMFTHIAVPDRYRDIGYDSIQLMVNDSGKIWANFDYTNNLRFKKDTVYTGDTAYRLWGFSFRLSPDLYITTKDTKGITRFGNGTYVEGQCDSIIIDSFKIRITKVLYK